MIFCFLQAAEALIGAISLAEMIWHGNLREVSLGEYDFSIDDCLLMQILSDDGVISRLVSLMWVIAKYAFDEFLI